MGWGGQQARGVWFQKVLFGGGEGSKLGSAIPKTQLLSSDFSLTLVM